MIIITRIKNILLSIFIFSMMIAFFANAKYYSGIITDTLIFCGKSVIPSLFPYMIISGFIISSGILNGFIRIIPTKILNVLGICKIYLLPILFGSVCGFVVGAKGACEIYNKRTKTSDSSFSDSVILSSNAGIGFVVGTVGVILWDSIQFGLFLYFSQILFSLILNIFFSKKTKTEEDKIKTINKPVLSSFTGSVSDSVISILYICGYVVFFSCILSFFISLFDLDSFPLAKAILSIFLEFCKGTSISLSVHNPSVSSALTGFCVGFGGLCVHLQIYSVCSNFPLNKFKFFLLKFLQGVLCAVSCSIYISIHKIEPAKKTFIVSSPEYKNLLIFIPLLIILAFIFLFKKKRLKKAKIYFIIKK